MKQIVILYHAECPDGFSAAWAAYRKFGDSADYVGVSNDDPVRSDLEGKEVYLLDFSYPAEIIVDLISKTKRITAIDHHFSREKSVKMTKDYSFSMNNSGAVLAWKYFHKDEPVPKFLEYIEDRDLFRFLLPNSRATCAFIDTQDFDFKVWDKLAEDIADETRYKECLIKGEAIAKYEEGLVKRLVKENAKLVEFEGLTTFVVNVPHMFASDVGAILYSKKPPMAVTWYDGKDHIHVSLRSDGTVDVSAIAAKYGGGGHKASAGFSLSSIDSFPWKEIK